MQLHTLIRTELIIYIINEAEPYKEVLFLLKTHIFIFRLIIIPIRCLFIIDDVVKALFTLDIDLVCILFLIASLLKVIFIWWYHAHIHLN